MDLTQFTNPFGGQRGDIGDLSTWWRLILGGTVLAIVFGIGNQIAQRVTGALGGLPGIGGFARQLPPPVELFGEPAITVELPGAARRQFRTVG